MKTTTVLVLSILLLAGCATTASNDADAYIRSQDPRFAEAFNRGDWNTLTGMYTDDAVVLMPNSETMRGPAAIRQGFSAMSGMNANLRIVPESIVQSGDIAYETGRYEMSMTGGSDRGKYLTVWRRQPDGTWKIVADMINTSMPAPR
jgi:ketosteroid isomerase-like protein